MGTKGYGRGEEKGGKGEKEKPRCGLNHGERRKRERTEGGKESSKGNGGGNQKVKSEPKFNHSKL
jgi:hypothetical protein